MEVPVTQMIVNEHDHWAFPNSLLICPRCGFEYVHPIEVRVNAGGVITVIDQHGTRQEAGKAAGRGVRIALRYICEENHEFTMVQQFHKGVTFISTDFDPAAPENLWTLGTIWRD